jgi:hypothetical protein
MSDKKQKAKKEPIVEKDEPQTPADIYAPCLLMDGESYFQVGQEVVVLRTGALFFLTHSCSHPVMRDFVEFLCCEMRPAHEAICMGPSASSSVLMDFVFPDIMLHGRVLVLSLGRCGTGDPDYVVEKAKYEARMRHDWKVGSRGLVAFAEGPKEVTVTRIVERVYRWRTDPFDAFEVLPDGDEETLTMGPYEMDFIA